MTSVPESKQAKQSEPRTGPEESGWGRKLGQVFTHPEEVPRLWGLSLVACFMGGLVALVAVAAVFHQDALGEALVTNKERTLRKCVSRVGALFGTEQRRASREVVRIRSEHGLEYVALVLPDGSVFAHSNPGQTGNSGPAGENGVGDLRTFTEPVLDETGQQVGTFEAGYLVEVPAWNNREAVLWLGLVVLVSLAFLLGLYRVLRRSLRPVSKVRDRLLSYGEEMESRLDELMIQDESGALAVAWNHLLTTTGAMRSTLESIESRRELAETLRNHDAGQAKEALEWHPDGVLLIDEFCQVSLVNKACRLLARLGEEDPLGKPAANISRDAELNQVIERLASSSAKSHRATVYHTLQEDGLSTTLAITVASIQSEDGPGGTLLVFRDASQQKQAEKARDDFLHQVTHEFRTPLSNIRAYTETLMEGILEDKDAQRECLNVINSEAARLGRLVEDVLTASQLEVGTARLRLSEVDLGRLLQQAVQDLQATADERDVDLHISLPPKVPKIQGDKDRLAVVFNNMLGNAIKYTDSGGNVSLACEDRGRDLEITVVDTGIGIVEEELPRVFDKFFRSSSEAVRERPGTGLGLATARQIARLHGGEITVQSKPGEGSKFTVTLPVYEVRPASGKRALEPRGATAGAE